MNAKSFERMVKLVIAYIDRHTITKSIRELGFAVHCDTWIRENESSGYFYATLRIGLYGVPSSYMTICDKGIKSAEPSIRPFELMDLYMKALKNLHKLAINSKYGLNCYMPAYLFNTIMEDTDMTYTLLNKKNYRGGMKYLMTVEPEKIHFNGPATIVEWNDGTKTVVKCQKGDTFDPLTGVAMCCMKKMLGTNESGSNYLNNVTKLIDEAWEAKNKRYEKANKKLRNCEKDKEDEGKDN